MSKKAPSFAEMTLQEKKKHIAENYEKMREKDAQPVRGKFIFHEAPGHTLSFSFRKYKGDDIVKYDLTDGQIYTLPLGVAKHLNTNIAVPEYGYVQGEEVVQGNNFERGQVMKVTRKVRRCSFQSLEFLDIDDFTTADIVTVERVA